jgi:hypothetical protein
MMMRERSGRRSKLAPAVLVSLLSAATLGAAGRPPEVGPNVLVNGPQFGRYGRVGNALAVSEDGSRMVAVWDDMRGACGPPYNLPCPTPWSPPGLTSVAASTDGGRTWTELGSPPTNGSFMTGGHGWLDRGLYGSQETFYLVSRARLLDNPHPNYGQIGMLLHRGRFENGRFVWKDSRYIGPAAGEKDDYWRGPNVAAAKDGSGRVYVAYTNLTNLDNVCARPGTSGGRIEVRHSDDGGDTWSDAAVVSADDTLMTTDPKDPRCGTWAHFQFTPNLALGPHGEVYVTWQYGPEFEIDFKTSNLRGKPTVGYGFSRSLNGGRTFSPPRYAAIGNSLLENGPAGFSKDFMNDTARITVAGGGPHRGRIYITYASATEEVTCHDDFLSGRSYSPVSSQAYLAWSDDQGQLWHTGVPLGPPVPRTGVKRFYPAPAVRADGTLDAVYFESRETAVGTAACPMPLGSGLWKSAGARSLVDVWWVRSSDGGATFGPPVRVTSVTSDWCGVLFESAGFFFANFGDYLGIAGGRDHTSLVWTDGRNGVPDVYFTTLGGRD